MKHSLNYASFDVLTMILHYLDLRDSLRFIVSCKHVYSEYKSNKRWVDTYLTHKIYRYFGFTRDRLLVTPGLIRDCFGLYNHFKNHKYSDRVDFVFYLIEKNIESLHLFQSILSECVFRETTSLTALDQLSSMQTLYRSRTISSNIISTNDLQYILTYCTTDQLRIILKKFTVSCETLANTISDIINQPDRYDKIKLYIDYILYKHYFKQFHREIDRRYFNYICVHFIKRNNTSNLQTLFAKYDNYNIRTIDYQFFVNKCIEMEDTENLSFLVNHCHERNMQTSQKTYIVIPKHYITTLSKRHSFDYLQFLIDNHIGTNINTMTYVYSICQGLLITSAKNNIEYISERLSRFLTTSNVETVCKYLTDSSRNTY